MRQSRSASRFSTTAVLTVSVCVAWAGAARTQPRADQEQQREQWQRVSDILRAMNVQPGAVVADVGAGDGFFTSRLAAAVGASGRVIAVDVNDSQLERLRRRLSREPHDNVTVTKGTASDPGLPEGALDAALIVNAYHEMPEHQAMLAAIRRALKPSGRLVIVEPIAEARRAAAREEQARNHEIAPELALEDLRAAGFRIVGLEDPFTRRGHRVEWIVTAMPGTVPSSVTEVPSTPVDVGAEGDPGLRIPVEEFEGLVRSGRGTLIDVRDEGMFARGHIPNAVLIPIQDIEAAAERLKAMNRPFVTYCS